MPLNHLMEDAATAEVGPHGHDTGVTTTAEYVGKVVDATAPGVPQGHTNNQRRHLRVAAMAKRILD